MTYFIWTHAKWCHQCWSNEQSNLVGETGETSDTGDFGHYTQRSAEALNHESIAIYMYTNTKYDAYKRLRMLGELA